MHRRALLKSAAALALSTVAEPLMRAGETAVPVIDSHIHLFDPTRPGGIPWPEKTDTVLYQPALPARYERLAQPHHVVGARRGCSPWMVDNFWLQDVVEQNPIMLGFIGDLPRARISARPSIAFIAARNSSGFGTATSGAATWVRPRTILSSCRD
jgi:hypothetical protein